MDKDILVTVTCVTRRPTVSNLSLMHGVITLAHYPLDLIEQIIFQVVDPFDLFSLALSSKQLYALIVPSQLDFRTIRCDPRRGRLWTYLREQPRLTSRIRSLELVIENASVAPVIPRVEANQLGGQHVIDVDHMPQSLDDCLLMLIGAVKYMNNLIRFCWCDCGPASNEMEALIAALFKYCPDLRELQVQYGRRETSTYLMVKSKLSVRQKSCLPLALSLNLGSSFYNFTVYQKFLFRSLVIPWIRRITVKS